MNPDILLLIKGCETALQISKPITLKIKTRGLKGDTKSLAGYCESYFRRGKLTGHKVVIHLDIVLESCYNIYGVIAHELVHASMMEHEIFDSDYHHDKTFQRMCQVLEEYLREIGFPDIGPLYNPLTDTE